jgi:hypothetical protein
MRSRRFGDEILRAVEVIGRPPVRVENGLGGARVLLYWVIACAVSFLVAIRRD